MDTGQKFEKYIGINVIIIFVFLMGIGGCATSGPKYSAAKNTIAPLSEDQARIIIYRPDTMFGAAMTPDIYINDKKVAESRRGTVFYFDINPGKHEVKIPAVLYPGATTITIELGRNEMIYLKTFFGGSSFAGRTNIEEVNPERGLAEIADLTYVAEPMK